jgi:hypothetical protein
LDSFLKAKFERISRRTEKQLCLKIARWCATGKIRSIHRIDNPHNKRSYIVELEVGSVADWVENRRRAYFGGTSIFTEQLDEGVVVRLSKGGLE